MKRPVQAAILALIVLLAYCILIFIIPFQRTAVFWATLIFTVVAFVIAALSFYQAFGDDTVKSKFYGFPIARIGGLYAAVQLVVGLVFLILAGICPLWPALAIYVLLLAAAVAGLFSADTVVEEISRQDDSLKHQVQFMRALQSQMEPLANLCREPAAREAVKTLTERIRYSDPVSSPGLAAAERDLQAAVQQLQQAVTEQDQPAICRLCTDASALLAERNRLCKLQK